MRFRPVTWPADSMRYRNARAPRTRRELGADSAFGFDGMCARLDAAAEQKDLCALTIELSGAHADV